MDGALREVQADHFQQTVERNRGKPLISARMNGKTEHVKVAGGLLAETGDL